jgi:hypothetical protein
MSVGPFVVSHGHAKQRITKRVWVPVEGGLTEPLRRHARTCCG